MESEFINSDLISQLTSEDPLDILKNNTNGNNNNNNRKRKLDQAHLFDDESSSDDDIILEDQPSTSGKGNGNNTTSPTYVIERSEGLTMKISKHINVLQNQTKEYETLLKNVRQQAAVLKKIEQLFKNVSLDDAVLMNSHELFVYIESMKKFKTLYEELSAVVNDVEIINSIKDKYDQCMANLKNIEAISYQNLHEINKLLSGQGMLSKKICTICFHNKELYVNSCGHSMCSECWQKCIDKCKNCPTCRKKIDRVRIRLY